MTILRDRVGPVAIITINRPEKRNALDPATTEALGLALIDAESDPEVLAVVLTGAGDRAFCAGMDLNGVGATPSTAAPTAGALAYQRFQSEPLNKPVIGAANATAVAGGFELLLSCDMVVAADDAMFALPEVRRGLVAGAGGTMLPYRIPMAIALELTLTGEPIPATRLYELGLANRVVARERVRDVAVTLALAVAANSPNAVRITRELMYETRNHPAAVCWQSVRAALPAVLASADAREGSRAFLERRTPQWASVATPSTPIAPAPDR